MVSVIIPVYNRAELVTRAIRSVLDQSYRELEIVVVDDGSTDDTARRVRLEFGEEVCLLQHPHTRGVSAARNLGIAKSAGEWVALLDSDDVWLPSKLEEQLRRVAADGRRVCHTNEIWIRDGVRVNQRKRHQKHGGDIYEQALRLCPMSPSSILVNRLVFDVVGVFDETLPACEDYDLFLRLTNHCRVSYIDEELIVKYGGHDDQLSRAFPAMDRFRVYALDKMLNSGTLIDRSRAEATREMLVRKAQIVLGGARRRSNHDLAGIMEEYLSRWG